MIKDERHKLHTKGKRAGDEVTGVFVDDKGFETQICTHAHSPNVFYVEHRKADRRIP